MAKENILIIEDEEDIRGLIEYNLKKEGYQVSTAGTGEKGLQAARAASPALILLDLMLPGLDGFEVCKLLKQEKNTAKIPVIMLTAKGEEADVVTGLELGAEDYITKPFSPKVLVARIRAVLRRGRRDQSQGGSTVSLHNILIDSSKFAVFVDGEQVDLTATEFHVLHFLVQHPGWVYTRSQIIDSVKGTDYPVTDRSVDVQIVGLRKKLGSAGQYIETVRGIGYRFKE